MSLLGSFYAFLTAIGFKTNVLTQRFLQEEGATKADTYTIYRYAFFPSLIWALIFVRGSDINLVIHSPKYLAIFGVIIVLWNLQALLISVVINSTSSMVLFTTYFNVLLLPLFLAFGTFFNHDTPNVLAIVAIAILLVALLIKPTPHHTNLRPHLSQPLYLILALIFAKACCDTVLQGVAREALKQIHPAVFLGLFSLPTLGVCALISTFWFGSRNQEAAVMKNKQRTAILLVPMTWFVASIPESFSLAAIPIYTFISINVATFAMDTASDVLHKRIHLTAQTVGFIALVLVGISLSVLSV